jgi:hypothetical protein
VEFEIARGDIDPKLPLIYRWEVLDSTGRRVYCYVGKSKNGSLRAVNEYKNNLRKYFAGEPYRKGKPDGWRPVHLRLAEAVKNRERLVLTYLCNVQPHENINEVEARLRAAHGCY